MSQVTSKNHTHHHLCDGPCKRVIGAGNIPGNDQTWCSQEKAHGVGYCVTCKAVLDTAAEKGNDEKTMLAALATFWREHKMDKPEDIQRLTDAMTTNLHKTAKSVVKPVKEGEIKMGQHKRALEEKQTKTITAKNTRRLHIVNKSQTEQVAPPVKKSATVPQDVAEKKARHKALGEEREQLKAELKRMTDTDVKSSSGEASAELKNFRIHVAQRCQEIWDERNVIFYSLRGKAVPQTKAA